MKKILTTISIIALALCANAKTVDDIAAEYNSKAKSASDFDAAVELVKANTAEMPALIAAWAAEPNAKFSAFEDAAKTWTVEQRKRQQALTMVFGQYLIWNLDQIKKLPLRVACIATSTRIIQAYEVDNPSLYGELKAANFVVDGVKLPTYAIINMAVNARDLALIASMPVEDVAANGNYINAIVRYYATTDDIVAAKAKIREIENWYLVRGRDIPTKITALSKVLTSRLVDQKVAK